MKLYYMTQDAIDELKGNFHHYAEFYKNNNKKEINEWLRSSYGLKESNIECDGFTLEKDDNIPEKIGKDYYYESDLKNIKIMYDNLKDKLSLKAASNEKLWTGMAHTYFWDYIQYRRANEIRSGKEDEIRKSFLWNSQKSGGTRRAREVSCLSRLWWAGYYTYDEESADGYYLTDFYFGKAMPSRLLLLASRHFTANKEVCIGLLRSLKKRYDNGDKDCLERYHVEAALTYLNGIGGMTSLDFLSRSEIEALIDKRMNQVYGTI